MKSWKTSIGINCFTMVFGPATIGADGFEVRQPLDTMVFQWFPMEGNHWSNDGIVTIHRRGLGGCYRQGWVLGLPTALGQPVNWQMYLFKFQNVFV